MTSLVAVLALVNIVLGQYSASTGRDCLPKRFRRLLRRVPASEEDHRTRGISLTLNGAAVMMLVLGITAEPLIGMYNRGQFSRDAVFFISTVGMLAALYCIVWSYTLNQRVRYVSTKASTDGHPQVPPA
jgi:hypothetical protein